MSDTIAVNSTLAVSDVLGRLESFGRDWRMSKMHAIPGVGRFDTCRIVIRSNQFVLTLGPQPKGPHILWSGEVSSAPQSGGSRLIAAAHQTLPSKIAGGITCCTPFIGAVLASPSGISIREWPWVFGLFGGVVFATLQYLGSEWRAKQQSAVVIAILSSITEVDSATGLTSE